MSKIKRYYWREIQLLTIPRFAAWAETNGARDWLQASRSRRDVYEAFEREAIEEVKQLHATNPKYAYEEEPQSEVLTRFGVEIVNLRPRRVQRADEIVFAFESCYVGSSTEVAALHFKRLGYTPIFTESRPFHVLFGALMWPLIQDPTDPKALCVGRRRRRDPAPPGGQDPLWTTHPADFGTAEYGRRRSGAIGRHISALREVKGELSQLLDLWMEPSNEVRTYLAADRPEDVTTAKRLLKLLPGNTVITILDYLSRAYWDRYCGWPDLLFHRRSEFFFAEVKFSGDSLRENQKSWISGNSSYLHLPFRLVKVHRTRAD